MAPRHSNFYARGTDEQMDALTKALDAHERRTGHRLTQADVVRGGPRAFCQAEGVDFPSFKARPSSRSGAGRGPTDN